MEKIKNWADINHSSIIAVVSIFVVAFFIKKFLNVFITKTIKRVVRSHNHSRHAEELQREKTLIELTGGIASLFYWPIVVLVAISQIGVDIAPLIAGAGIIGLAVGFGAQSLVKDVIAGLFIIAENQYRVGDVVDLDGKSSGVVEKITLRITVLRDLDGIEQVVPNGVIERVSNYTKDFAGINLNIGVAYDTDIEKVTKIINKVGEDMEKDDEWKDKIIEKPEFKRIDNFLESSIDLKILGKVQPLTQWAVTGELRRRLKIEFDKNGIEIPYPQRVIRNINDSEDAEDDSAE